MNILTQLEFELNFTPNEIDLARYILNNGQDVINMSIQTLAQKSYTSPATIVRFCKKLDTNGFNDFKIKLATELTNRQVSNDKVDVNFPFTTIDTPETIAHNLLQLDLEVLQDTLNLIDFNNLKKIVKLFNRYDIVDIYGSSNSILLAMSFQHKMTRIGRMVNLRSLEGEQIFMARASNNKHLSMIISYSGETDVILRTARTLKQKGSPIIAITSVGDNVLSHFADYVIHIDSKEKIFNKIAPFASSISIGYILDLLFSSIFVESYEKNMKLKLSFDKAEDSRHPKLSPINE